MLKIILPFFLALLFSQAVHAQFSVSGNIKDQQSGAVLSGASVRIKSVTDASLLQSTLSDSAGRFQFQNLPADSFLLSVSFVGFKDASRGFRLDTTVKNNLDVSIALAQASSQNLATVVITAKTPLARQKEDTLEFNASQIKVNPDASAEDLARKVPGITIENGQVKANGENVQKVTLDGRELFGDDATAALRNLPAEIIDKIQVFDRLSDQAQFTGFDDGNTTKGINIVTKANMRNGQFGRVYAGYGTDGRYAAGGNTTLLHENRRVSVVGNFNNINQQNFSQQDLLGVTSTSSRGGGFRGGGGGGGGRGGGGNRGGSGGGGGNFGGFGNNANFLVGQQAGINRTNALGINFSDVYGKKLTVTGSYFFNNTTNNTNELSSQQYFSGAVISQKNTASSTNNNHRINMRLEWRLDSNNQIFFLPNLSFQANNADRSTSTDNSNALRRVVTTNLTNSNTSGNNLNNTILWRHSFARRGRTFSVNLNTSSNSRQGDVYVNTLQQKFNSSGIPVDSAANRYTDQENKGYQLSANLVYTEPLSQKSQLQVNFNPSYSSSKANQQAFRNDVEGKYTIFDSTLSNRFDNTTKTQNAGLSYRYGDRDNMLSFGANYQHNTLESDQAFPRALYVNKSFSNILPSAMLRLKLSTRSSLRVFYRTNTNNPSVTQLSDVVDITNRPFVTAGNPDLKQQVTNFFSGRYTYTNTGKSIVLVGNIFYQTASDYISNATYINEDTVSHAITVYRNKILLAPAEQLSYPVNLDGYRSIRSFVTLAFPVSFIKSNFNLNGGVTFNRLPGSLNGITSTSKNTTYSAGAVIASNVSQYVDFTVSYTANFNTVENALQANYNDKYFQHAAGLQLNLLSRSGWFFQNDISNQLYNGLTQGYNQNYTLWNMSAGKKIFKDKKGEIKLTVFDLLRQNQSISRDVTSTYIEDTQNQVLRQYFMLQFTYNLRNFGTAAARQMNRDGGEERHFGGPPRF